MGTATFDEGSGIEYHPPKGSSVWMLAAAFFALLTVYSFLKPFLWPDHEVTARDAGPPIEMSTAVQAEHVP